MTTLQEMLLTPDVAPRVVADCQALVASELDSKGGLSGTATKAAYKVVTAFAPGYYTDTLAGMLPDMADALPSSLVEDAVSAFTPLARGAIEASPDVAPTIQSHFTWDLGRPEELQAAALVALARFAGRDPTCQRFTVIALLPPALRLHR